MFSCLFELNPLASFEMLHPQHWNNFLTRCVGRAEDSLDACYELAKNKDKHPPGWRSSFWRGGVVSIHNKIIISSETLLTHNYHFSPTLDKPLPSTTIHTSYRHWWFRSYGHLLFRRLPHSQHQPFIPNRQGRHSSWPNTTIYCHRGLKFASAPIRIPNHRTHNFRLPPYHNRGSPTLWCRMYSHLHVWGSDCTRYPRHTSAYRMALGLRATNLENLPATSWCKPTQNASYRKSGYIRSA